MIALVTLPLSITPPGLLIAAAGAALFVLMLHWRKERGKSGELWPIF